MSAPTLPRHPGPAAPVQRPGRVGEDSPRIDGTPKVRGEFAYSSDLRKDGMLWGATLRSPHPHATIESIDIGRALALPGVHAVLTHEDVPGRKVYGMEIPDQPVLAWEHVRYQGEPIALVAADHPETARRALDRIAVAYEELEPVSDPERAMAPGAPRLHLSGNVLRHIALRHGEPAPAADVVVTGAYEVGMQDQAFLGPESGLAVPDGEGGVDLYIATQWLHVDRDQLAESLDLPPERVRLEMSGVGGAFGGREDLSMQVHACLLALHTDRPVKIVYDREESFFGHVHRHPCRMEYEHGATSDGRLVYVTARIVLDGGAYASSSTAVCSNAACFAAGPYDVPNARVDAIVTYTNNPPCGAMRGFGAVQTAFGHESQMDKLAAALDIDPVELRILNAMAPGHRLITGQRIPEPAPVAELLERLRAMPLPPPAAPAGERDLRELPGGVSNTTHGEGVRRGVGYGLGFKNVGYSEGFDDYATARVALSLRDGEPLAEVHTAAAEVGQGLVTVQAQIARTELGVERVAVLTADTAVGSAGSSSASRQTYMTGGAVKLACEAVRERLLERAADQLGGSGLRLEDGAVASPAGDRVALAELLTEGPVEETVEFHHRETYPLDADGQGDAHLQFAFSAHRAVVDVDVELGLVRVVELATTQEVGKVDQPAGARGPDRRRDRAGARAGAAGGDPGARRQDPERVVHGLPAADDPRHAAGRQGGARARRPRGAVRPQGRRRAAHHLHPARRGRRRARRDGPAARADPRPSGAHRRPPRPIPERAATDARIQPRRADRRGHRRHRGGQRGAARRGPPRGGRVGAGPRGRSRQHPAERRTLRGAGGGAAGGRRRARRRSARGRGQGRVPGRRRAVSVHVSDGRDRLTVAAAGALEREPFLARFGGVYERSPWVADGAWRQRPFATLPALRAAFERTVLDAGADRQIALIRAHPELAGREARDGELTAESGSEQASAGLDRLTADDARRAHAAQRRLPRDVRLPDGGGRAQPHAGVHPGAGRSAVGQPARGGGADGAAGDLRDRRRAAGRAGGRQRSRRGGSVSGAGRIVLGRNHYGKGRVRVVKVARGPERHELRDLQVDIALEGDFGAAHVEGDNTGLLATDTMRNTAYALAQEHLTGAIETYGLALAERFLAAAPSVRQARVRIVEHPWRRLESGGRPEPHGFRRDASGDRVATITGTAEGARFEAGIEDLLVLRTAGSGWAGFLREEYTTLPDTDDRIVATVVTASWTYAGGRELDFDGLWHGVRASVLRAFCDHYSPSVQMTLYHMGEAVLAAHPEVERIHFSLPNQHHLLYDLERFGMANDNEIFQATTEPYGLIEGTVERSA